MKTNCEFFDECRKPVQCCTSKCPEYVRRKHVGWRNDCHDWFCGCGHWNGPNLSMCAMCGRSPNESLPLNSK
ncbi:MAG: hypothetical protein WC979_09505 [Candidatus Pacearchaeota archaeon]|jgi:hypothetical protein